jgi:hypothetical protein
MKSPRPVGSALYSWAIRVEVFIHVGVFNHTSIAKSSVSVTNFLLGRPQVEFPVDVLLCGSESLIGVVVFIECNLDFDLLTRW